MRLYVVTLYVEGGDHDGETYACGPFETEQEARVNEAQLSPHGTADTHALEQNADGIEFVIGA